VRAALAAFLAWGLVPIFWKFLARVPSLELVLHRVIWSFVCYATILLFMVWRQRVTHTATDSRPAGLRLPNSREWFFIVSASLLVSINWYAFIYAVNHGRVLEGSLAYFLTPLLNVVTGVLVFKESLSGKVKLALLAATLGVAMLFLKSDQMPWLALVMALTFSCYGMLKKRLTLLPVYSSMLETLVLLPFVILAAVFLRTQSTISLAPFEISLMLLSGLVTGLPLLWFSQAAQLLPFSIMGFFQFIPPTVSFLIAVFMYNENFGILEAAAFSCIWLGAGFFISHLADRYRAIPIT
jgi:chloramphenicol-sensitive protein RarD